MGSGVVTSGRVIAFEGVDGAGKSTALALVAERLRARGTTVFLPRLGKDHASVPVRAIREITRDRRHVELDAHAELLLYCAREAQITAELVRPAVRRGETVLIDRSVLTAEVLGQARGLSRQICEDAARVAAADLLPDLTIVFDVHPRTSRIRKRLERLRSRKQERGGRKGLAGSAFKERVRDLYQSLAEERGYAVLHAERANPVLLAERAIALIDHGARADTGERESDRTPLWRVPPELDLLQALERLPLQIALLMGNGLICARELRARAAAEEPALCASTLDVEDPLREQLAEQYPSHALRGYGGGRPLRGPADLRLRLLGREPAACIAALKHLTEPQADGLREQHAGSLPDAVLVSLAGRRDDFAVQLRARCFPAASDRARASSLQGCADEHAWALREELFERDVVFGLQSLAGTADARGQRWLERYADAAPATVLGALGGRSDAPAHALRAALFETGREVIDSVRGLDDEPSWALRDRALSRWPSTVAHSLLRLQDDPRTQAMRARCADLGVGDVHTLRRLQGLREQSLWPDWVKARAKSSQVEVDSLDD